MKTDRRQVYFRGGVLLLLITLPFTYITSQQKGPSTPATSTTPAPTTPNGTTEPVPENALAEAGKFHIGSDPTVWIMIFIFNLALAVVIERIYIIYKNRGNNAKLVQMLTDKLSAENAGTAELAEAVNTREYGVEGRVAAVTLKGWAKNEHTMKEYADAALIAERRNLEKRLVILSTLGNNTPFIGLLGTVLGIMKAFRDLAIMGEGGPAVVMKGISEALIATAMGLAVAIPVVIAYNALSKSVNDSMSRAEEISTLLRAIRLSK